MVYEFKKMKGMMNRQSPILDQIILAKFIEEGHFLRHIRKMRLVYSERRKILVKLIEENLGDYLPIEPSSAGIPANIHAAIKHIDYQKGNFDGNGLNYLGSEFLYKYYLSCGRT